MAVSGMLGSIGGGLAMGIMSAAFSPVIGAGFGMGYGYGLTQGYAKGQYENINLNAYTQAATYARSNVLKMQSDYALGIMKQNLGFTFTGLSI
jgi:hypothetical protein